MPNMRLDQSGELFWDTPSRSAWVLTHILTLATGSELRGSDVYLHIVKNLSGNVSLNSASVRALG